MITARTANDSKLQIELEQRYDPTIVTIKFTVIPDGKDAAVVLDAFLTNRQAAQLARYLNQRSTENINRLTKALEE